MTICTKATLAYLILRLLVYNCHIVQYNIYIYLYIYIILSLYYNNVSTLHLFMF